MNRAEILQELESILGRCSIETCQTVEECLLAQQGASDLRVQGKTDVMNNPGFRPCTHWGPVSKLVGEFEIAEE